MYTCNYTRASTRTRTCTYVYTHTHQRVSVAVRARLYTYTLSLSLTHTHMYRHTHQEVFVAVGASLYIISLSLLISRPLSLLICARTHTYTLTHKNTHSHTQQDISGAARARLWLPPYFSKSFYPCIYTETHRNAHVNTHVNTHTHIHTHACKPIQNMSARAWSVNCASKRLPARYIVQNNKCSFISHTLSLLHARVLSHSLYLSLAHTHKCIHTYTHTIPTSDEKNTEVLQRGTCETHCPKFFANSRLFVELYLARHV